VGTRKHADGTATWRWREDDGHLPHHGNRGGVHLHRILQGHREIVGDQRFFDLARTLQRKYAYSTKEFITEAKRASRLAKLDQ
jgi:hypothetical protein